MTDSSHSKEAQDLNDWDSIRPFRAGELVYFEGDYSTIDSISGIWVVLFKDGAYKGVGMDEFLKTAKHIGDGP